MVCFGYTVKIDINYIRKLIRIYCVCVCVGGGVCAGMILNSREWHFGKFPYRHTSYTQHLLFEHQEALLLRITNGMAYSNLALGILINQNIFLFVFVHENSYVLLLRLISELFGDLSLILSLACSRALVLHANNKWYKRLECSIEWWWLLQLLQTLTYGFSWALFSSTFHDSTEILFFLARSSIFFLSSSLSLSTSLYSPLSIFLSLFSPPLSISATSPIHYSSSKCRPLNHVVGAQVVSLQTWTNKPKVWSKYCDSDQRTHKLFQYYNNSNMVNGRLPEALVNIPHHTIHLESAKYPRKLLTWDNSENTWSSIQT